MKDLTPAEIALSQDVQNFPKDPIYSEVPGMFIPLQDMIWLRKVENTILTTESGLILGTAEVENLVTPNTGVIMAVGPKVEAYLIPGLKVLYNPMLERNEAIRIKGKDYIRARVMDIYTILPPDAYIWTRVKSHAELQREATREGFKRVDASEEQITKDRLAKYDDDVHSSNNKTKRKNLQTKKQKP